MSKYSKLFPRRNEALTHIISNRLPSFIIVKKLNNMLYKTIVSYWHHQSSTQLLNNIHNTIYTTIYTQQYTHCQLHIHAVPFLLVYLHVQLCLHRDSSTVAERSHDSCTTWLLYSSGEKSRPLHYLTHGCQLLPS